MTQYLCQALLKRLAVMTTAVAMGASPTSAALEPVPAEAVRELLDDDLLDGMDDPDRQALLRLISVHPDARVRVLVVDRLAERIEGLTPQVESALSELVADPSNSVRDAARRCFHQLLSKQDGIERLRVVCEWARAPEAARRLAVAQALRRGLSTPVALTALRLLRGDPDVEVRRVARAARRS